MSQQHAFATDVDGQHTVFIGPSSGRARSLLDDLLPEELGELTAWSANQPGDQQRGGAVDLMNWPGWQAVARRKAGLQMDEGSLLLSQSGYSPGVLARKFNPAA